MKLSCPGCKARLQVDDESYREKVLLQCPECLYVFLARSDGEEPSATAEPAPEEPAGDATLLTSDFTPQTDAREFQWNVEGASVTVIAGDSQGIHRRITGRQLVVGRKGADLVIEDKAVSREHCEIFQGKDGWRVVDRKSTNGTFVNGQRIEDEALHHLDEIRIGQTVILFAEAESPQARSRVEREAEQPPDLDVTRVDGAGRDKETPLPEGREFYLEHMSGPRKGRSVKFDKTRLIVGRGEEAEIKLDDQNASRKHAMIEVYSRDQVYITDLASQNGTWLNGMKIRTTKLLPNDLVRMGDTVLKFVIIDQP